MTTDLSNHHPSGASRESPSCDHPEPQNPIDSDRIARLENQLSESESRFWNLFKNHSRSILVIEPGDGRIVKANPEAVQFFRYPEQELLGLNIFRISTLPHKEVRRRIESALHHRENTFVSKYRLGDDQVRLVEVQASPIRFQERNLLLLLISDLTDQARMQEQLQYEKYRLWMILEGLEDSVCIADDELDIQYANTAAEQAFGSLWPGKKCFEFLHNRSDKCPWCKTDRLKEDSFQKSQCFSVKTGRHYDLHFSRFEGPDGRVSTLHLLRDTTERKWSEQDLKQYNARLRTLTQKIQQAREEEKKILARQLHDSVGQNLTAISLNLNVIHTLAGKTGEPLQQRLADTQSLVEETTRQIRDVMAELHPSVLDDYGLLAGLRLLANHYEKRLNIPIDVSGEDLSPRPRPEIETELFRIAQEALTNIAKHADAHSVRIEAIRNNSSIRMAIQDNGRGFDLDNTEPMKGGCGWGLLTMKERAETLGGRMQVHSQPEQGCQVEVLIPE